MEGRTANKHGPFPFAVEPSYVIRKFLDAQRIHNLTRYLQALHEHGCASTGTSATSRLVLCGGEYTHRCRNATCRAHDVAAQLLHQAQGRQDPGYSTTRGSPPPNLPSQVPCPPAPPPPPLTHTPFRADEFIKSDSGLQFDVDTAIHVLRQVMPGTPTIPCLCMCRCAGVSFAVCL